MTDDDRARIATRFQRGLEAECNRPMLMAGTPILIDGAPRTLCPGTVRMTGLYAGDGEVPTIVIRCSICDTWRPTDDQ